MALTEKQRRHLETRLQEERERALDILRRYDEGRDTSEESADGDLSNYPFHLADQGTDSYDQEMTTQLAQRASRDAVEADITGSAELLRLAERSELAERPRLAGDLYAGARQRARAFVRFLHAAVTGPWGIEPS